MPRSLILLVSMLQAGEAPPTPPASPWRAFGPEPEWSLTIADGRMVFVAKAQRPVSVPAVTPRRDDLGWAWKAKGMTIRSQPMGCQLEKGGARYPDMVTVTIGRREYMGCGGERLADDDLSGTSWEIVEIAGGKAGGANYGVDFMGGRFLAYDGCHRVQGRFSQSDGKLTMTPEGSTVGGCGPVTGPCAARFWQILEAPVATTFEGRESLVLAGAMGRIRLRKPDEQHLFSPEPPTACTAPAP